MAVTLSDFRARFPEFALAPDALVNACLADAAGQIDVAVWGGKANMGVKYLAAHLIATNPSGEFARLSKAQLGLLQSPWDTQYKEAYDALKRSVAAGFRVI